MLTFLEDKNNLMERLVKETLEICEKYQIKKVIAILLPRTGKIEESLNLHLEVKKLFDGNH